MKTLVSLTNRAFYFGWGSSLSNFLEKKQILLCVDFFLNCLSIKKWLINALHMHLTAFFFFFYMHGTPKYKMYIF